MTAIPKTLSWTLKCHCWRSCGGADAQTFSILSFSKKFFFYAKSKGVSCN